VRARFLEAFAQADTATRGAGMLAVHQDGKGRGGLNTRWAAVRESLAVVAYAGPIRTLDATILGDSVYIAIRPYDLGLAGRILSGVGLGPDGLRFLARPWAFGAPRVREAIERAAVEASGEGWRLAGAFDGAEGKHPFTLELSAGAEPRSLRIRLTSDDRNSIAIRYGPVRRFQSGRVPRWVEWTRGATRIRLDIEDHAAAKPSQFRRLPPARDDWTILALDDPRGRDLLRRLFGVGDSEAAP
jgi:ribosomal protein L24E